MEHHTRKEKEFEMIYRQFQNVVYQASLYYLKEEVAAEEITQKVFYELYLHFDGANIEHLYTYLCRAARNTALNWAQHHKRLVYVTSTQFLEDINTTEETPETAYFRKEQKKAAKELKESLLERLYAKNKIWHEAVYLVYCLEKPHAQVAEELGITRDVLDSRLYRAGQWVRKNYRNEYDEVCSWTC